MDTLAKPLIKYGTLVQAEKRISLQLLQLKLSGVQAVIPALLRLSLIHI